MEGASQRTKQKPRNITKMSADKGNPSAMFNYGDMLRKGDGIKENKAEAAKYYKMSADKGNPSMIIALFSFKDSFVVFYIKI